MSQQSKLFFLAVILGIAIVMPASVFIARTFDFTTDSELAANQLDALGEPPTKVDAVREQARWRTRIQQVGPGQAYAEFKQVYSGSNFGIQHTAAHVFGPALYETTGIPGITICDATFSFGCYHGFFGAALSENGLSIVPDLDRACVEKYGPHGTGCQHGIGHGLLEYLGYGNLVGALEACTLTTQVNILHGCTSGVFMENNVPLVLGDQTARSEARQLNPKNPYEPCTDIPEKFQESCYYELGQWWDKVYQQDYARIGQLCSKIKTPIYREDCYLGVGNEVAPSAAYDVAAAIGLCEKMPDREGKLICRAGASWSFFANEQYRELAPSICDGIEPYRGYSCTQKANVIENKKSEQKI